MSVPLTGFARSGEPAMRRDLLLRAAQVFPSPEPLDVLIRGGTIDRVTPSGALGRSFEGRTVDLEGRYLGAGLWDAHVHFTQWVINQQRLDLATADSAAQVIRRVREALSTGFPLTDGMLVGYGYRDGLWPEPTSLAALDEAAPAAPVVLVNGDLHSAWLNTPAALRLGLTPDASGVVSEAEWFAVLPRLETVSALPMRAFARAAAAAAARGVVGVVDFENIFNADVWPERVAAGVDALRVHASVWPEHLGEALLRGLRTGAPLEPTGLVRMGPLKVIVDGSLNTRTALCWEPYPGIDSSSPHACGVSAVSMLELRELLVRARAGGIAAAVHAIGDRANSEVLDVFDELAMTGTIEHAQLVREGDFARFAALGLVASVQPEHAMDDRDIADRYWQGRTERAFAYGSLHRAGVPMVLGSDAPVAPLDPWRAIAAAVSRSRDGRLPWHPEQVLPIEVALRASTRHGVETGAPADLVVTDLDPYDIDHEALRTMPVAATMRAGEFTHFAL